MGDWVHGTEESWSSGNAADWKCRRVYGSGGIRRVRGRVRCIRVVFEPKTSRVAGGEWGEEVVGKAARKRRGDL